MLLVSADQNKTCEIHITVDESWIFWFVIQSLIRPNGWVVLVIYANGTPY